MNEALSTKDVKKLAKASALSQSSNPKDQDRARARQTEVDYKDLVRQLKAKRKMKEDWKPEIEHSKLGDAVKKKREKKRKEAESSLPPHLKLDAMRKAFAHTNESFTIDKSAHKKVQKKAKLRNLAKGNTNPNEKAAAEKKAGGPKLMGEGKKKGLWDNIHAKRKRGESPAKPGDKDYPKTLNVEGLKQARKNVGADTCWDGYKAKGTKKKNGKEVPNCVKEGKTFDAWKKAAAKALGKKKEERTAQKAMDAGSRLRRKKQRQEYAAKISGSEDNVPDDIRD